MTAQGVQELFGWVFRKEIGRPMTAADLRRAVFVERRLERGASSGLDAIRIVRSALQRLLSTGDYQRVQRNG